MIKRFPLSTQQEVLEAQQLAYDGWLPVSNQYRIIVLVPVVGVFEELAKTHGPPIHDENHWRAMGIYSARHFLASMTNDATKIREGIPIGVYDALKKMVRP